MPVFKYETFREAQQSLWNFNPDKYYYQKVHALFILAEAINPVEYPSGLFKYKTLQEAQHQRWEWEIDNALHKESEQS